METHEVWEVCFDCGVSFPVLASDPMPTGGWLCDDCDKKHNPEDYED